MHTGIRAFLGAFTVLLLSVFPSVNPQGPSIPSATAATDQTAGTGVCAQSVESSATVTVTNVGDDCLITFTYGTNKWEVPARVTSIDYLIVGGGGGGAARNGGGGGGGEVLTDTNVTVTAGEAAITVGGGGLGSTEASGYTARRGNDGAASALTLPSASTVTARAGKKAGTTDSSNNDAIIDGGFSGNLNRGGDGIAGYVYGRGSSGWAAGGGAGAGGNGGDADQGIDNDNPGRGGMGGNGIASDITGSSVYYGGGGGGGTDAGLQLGRGRHGGGSGGVGFRDGGDGTANTGGGGGGGGYCNSGSGYDCSPWGVGSGNGGDGGSGVVIIRYTPVLTPDAPGSLSAVTSDGQVDLSWTAPTFTGDSAIADYLVEYRVDSGSWQTYNDGVSTTTSATLTGLSDTSTYEFRVSATNANSYTGTAATLTVSPELEPSFGAFGGTSDGFTVNIDNYDAAYTWAASATNGASVSINAGVATVTGLDPGEISAVTLTATKTNTFPGSATTTGTAALVVDLDAANTSSYPGTGSTWTNLVNGTNYVISNGSFSSVKGGAINFNGTSTYVDLNTPLLANSDFTFEAWVYDERGTGSRNILSSRDTPLFMSGTTLYAGTGGSGYYTLVSSSSFPQNAWRHVTLTFDDPTDTMTLFINGVEVSTDSTTNRFTQQKLYVGAHSLSNGTPVSFWDGFIAKARVYNEAVSTTQVLARYNATRSTYGLGQALNPTFATPTKSAAGYTAQISNYDSDFTWSASPSSGSATINGTGLVTVTGLSTGESSTVTVTSTRTGYDQGSATVTSTALDGYTVTYQKGDNGTGSNQIATKTEGSALSLVNETNGNSYFTRAGYVVAGWSTNSDGSTSDYELGASYTVDAAVTLYPVWSRATYTITYNNNHSSSQTTADYYSGDTVTLPEPTRSGFDLDGWFTASLGGNEIGQAGDEYSPLAAEKLILRYEFDDPASYTGSGTPVTDTASQVNNSVTGSVDGTLSGSPTFSPLDGQYLEFGGANDYIVTGNLKEDRVGDSGANLDVSLFAWIYPTGNGVIVTELGQTAISPLGGGLNGWHDSQIEVVNDKLNFGMWTSAGRSPSVTAVDITLNSWHYVGLTYDDSTNTMTAYVDGVEKGNQEFQRLGPSTGLYYGLGAGDSTNLGSGAYGNFRLGSFHVYDTGLDAETVERNYQATCARFDDSCTQQTVYAQWTQASATVTFNKGSASGASGENQTATKIYGTDLTLPDSSSANSDFTRAGYFVAGWSENADGLTTDYALGGTYTADAVDTLYPVWELNTCVVNSGDTYVNSGGGSGAVFGSSSSMIFKNASSSTSNSYNRAGYMRFEYDPSITWDGATLQVTVNSSSRGNSNSFYNGTNNFQVKVYAVGSADWNESTLSFNSANASTADWGLNVGTFPWTVDNGTLLGTIDIPTSTSAIGVSYGLSNAALDTFLNADSDGEVTFFLVRSDTQSQPNLGFATKDQTTYSAPTLLPHPASCAYTITYNKGTASGAGGSDNTSTKIHGTGLTLPDRTTANNYFTRTGYSVSGWATNADGTGTTYAFSATYTAERNQTLYPVWTPDTYTVTYNYDNATAGNSSASSTYTVDSVAVSLPTPTKTGYTLDGWYDASSGGNLVGAGGASYTPSANITIFAQWSAATFTVVYDYNSATGGNTTTDDDFTTGSGSPITLPTPTRTGYTFGGWYSDAALTSSVGAAGASYSPSVNLTVYAKWTADSRSVTYVGTNKTSGSVPTDATSYIIGNSVVVKANSGGLVRTGYDFAGWTENSDGSGTVLEAGDTLTVQTSDITLHAKWTAATYTITYHANGGSGTLARTTDTFTTGNSGVTLPGVGSLTKTGYNFGGWSTTPTGSALVGAYSTSQDRTLYAVWSIKSITYSYEKGSDGDGNSLSGFSFSASFPSGSVDDFGTSVTLSSSVDASIDADRNGSVDHQFFGWSDGTTVYDAGDTYVLGETNPTFTAQWIKVYSVRYALAGGSFAGSDSATDSQCVGTDDTCTDGQTITLNSRPSRAGYTFLGWEDQSGSVKSAASVTTITSSSYLFTAKWDPIDYTLNFNSLGGSNVISDYTQNIGDIVTIPDPGSKTGYSFGGWSDGSTLYGIGGSYTVGASGASFSAQWVPDVYRVTYDWQGGSSSTPDVSDTYTVGTGDMSLATASGSGYSRDGYTFSGWSTSAGGSVESAFQPTADDVLYAVWADGNYTLSYDGQGGTVSSGLGTVPRTTSITLPTPVRSNFTFVGWYDAASGGNLIGEGGDSFTPDASQTLYADWVQDSLYGVDLAALTTASNIEASSSMTQSLTLTYGGSTAQVTVPAGALDDGTDLTVRYFKDTNRQSDLISDENSYVFALLVSWILGSGSTATVPDTAAGKPITVTLTNSNIKAGAMVYQVIGETVTELARATVDGSVTVELTEDPEIVVAATKPSAPTSVTGTSGDTRVTVSWTAGSSGGSPITGYTVTANPGSAQCSTASTSCTINSLTNNTAYTFTVTASNALGVSIASTASSAVTPLGANYAVTFDANGGSSVSASSFFSGSTVSAPSSPSRSGYTFEGWSTTVDDDTTKVTFPYAPGVTNAITLYALWGVAPSAPTSRGSSEAVTARTVVPPGLSRSPVVLPSRVLGPTQPVAPPRPFSAPIVISPQRGFDPDAGSQARIGGLPATVTKSTPVPGAVNVGVGRVEVGITPQSPSSEARPVAPVAPSDVSVKSGQAALVAGAGLLPGSSLQVWLPGLDGSSPRELARIPVKSDGTFESELTFSARESDTPVPIGRQVLQVTGYDEDGNQTVVDMTINIAQGSPQPELNRAVGALPDLSKGQSLATSAGVPETVTIEVQPEKRSVAVLSGQWEFSVEVPEGSGDVGEPESGGSITLVQSKVALVSGDGFQPDTRVDIWLFSDPTLLGSVVVSADGSFTGEVYLDARFAVPGEHTLQLQGVAEDGFIKAANLGVEVQEPVELTTESATGLLWWVAGAFLVLVAVFLLVVALRRRTSKSAR